MESTLHLDCGFSHISLQFSDLPCGWALVRSTDGCAGDNAKSMMSTLSSFLTPLDGAGAGAAVGANGVKYCVLSCEGGPVPDPEYPPTETVEVDWCNCLEFAKSS